MLFHPIKTNFSKNIIFDVKIGKTNVKKVDSYRYVGVIIDNNIKRSEHVESIKTKLLKIIGGFYKTRYFLNEKSLYLIFDSLFISHIRHGLLC